MEAETSPNAGSRDASRLIAQLHSLRDIERVIAELIACGESAVEPLKEFLLEGRPSGTFEPRRAAVVALAGLGARDVLMDYLRIPKNIADPVARLGEEAVESAAARELAAWRTVDVFDFLMDISQDRTLQGLIESLGEFGRREAIPFLDSALEDDYYRTVAENAFRKLGSLARAELVLSAVTPLPDEFEESASSLRRRRSVLGLLVEIGIDAGDWSMLRRLLDEEDTELVVGAARLGVSWATEEDTVRIVHRLVELLPSVKWFLQDVIEDCLVRCPGETQRILRDAIGRRMELSETERLFDPALRILLRVQKRLGSQG